MLFWLVPLIVFIGFIAWAVYDRDSIIAAFGILFSLVAIVLVLFSGAITTALIPASVIDTQTHEIHALADNIQYKNQVSGNIFLTRSYTSETLKYNYMYMVENKGFAFNSVNATDCYLNITSDTPYLVINHYGCNNDIVNFLFGTGWNQSYEYIFHLPPDAVIIDNFTIDLE